MSEYGLRTSKANVGSAGRIAFGPGGVMFLADNAAAKIFAVDVRDPGPAAPADTPMDVDNIDVRVGSYLGCDAADVLIRDMAVHPVSQNVYLSVQRGRGDDARPVLIRISRKDGAISDVTLDGAPTAEFSLADAPASDDARMDVTLPLGEEGEEITVGDRKFRVLRRPIRSAAITDLAYVDGALLVTGLSNEEFSSKVRRIPFPFNGAQSGTSLEVFHVSHGKWETAAPIRTFVPYEGGKSILASYTCTPLVHFPLTTLTPGAKLVGRTVAELGAMNQPLDMVIFRHGGEDYLLVANSVHGLIKLACRDIDRQPALDQPKTPIGAARQAEPVPSVVRLANLNPHYVLALQADNGRHHLRSLDVATL